MISSVLQDFPFAKPVRKLHMLSSQTHIQEQRMLLDPCWSLCGSNILCSKPVFCVPRFLDCISERLAHTTVLYVSVCVSATGTGSRPRHEQQTIHCYTVLICLCIRLELSATTTANVVVLHQGTVACTNLILVAI